MRLINSSKEVGLDLSKVFKSLVSNDGLLAFCGLNCYFELTYANLNYVFYFYFEVYSF